MKCFSLEEMEKPRNLEKFLLNHGDEPTTNSIVLTGIILFLEKNKEIYGTNTRIIFKGMGKLVNFMKKVMGRHH